METYVTLICLALGAAWFVGWLVSNHFHHEKNFLNTFEKPLDNKGKWWYN